MSSPDLHAELRATRRELAAARRALQDRHVARARPISRDDTVRALTAVLQHSTSAALEDLRAERDRLARDVGFTRTLLRTARAKYSALRYSVWQLAQSYFAGFEAPEFVLEQIIEETEDSDDDRQWDGWVE